MPSAVTADVVELELRARTQSYLANINAAEKQFNRRMQQMTSAAEIMERRVTAAGNRMSNLLGRAIAAIGVASAVRESQQLADAWTASANKLAAAGVEMDKVNGTQQRLADLARETRSEYASTADLYAKLTRATKDLGASEVQVARATETVNKAFKAGGASTQEQVSSILQLSQALGSGLLQGDELRSIRENAPLLARAIAKEFDTTVAGLKKLGAEGELTSDRVFKAILIGSQEIDKQFAKTRGTIGEAFTALRTEAGRFLNEFDRATGATAGISGFVEKVADDFDLLAQAVVVAAATVSSALGVRMARSLGQTAVVNNAFVKSIMDGTIGIDKNAEAARRQAGEVLRSARAAREAAQIQLSASQQKIAALREEAAAYQQNIALAEAQRAVAAKSVATGRNAAGQFMAGGAARGERDTATKALIANRLALTRVTRDLAASESVLTATTNGYMAASTRVAVAERAMAAAMVTTSVVARAATVAMRGLSTAMSFFGGPIGVAIIGVAGALTYFATEATKAETAGENAQSVLDDLESKADSTRLTVDQLSQKLKENKTAADQSASGARNAANAYSETAAAAANAAEMIKYMTAAQRQSQLGKVEDALGDLDKAIGGFNPVGTNNEEAVANARKSVLRQFGVRGTAAGFGSSDVFVQQARDAIKAGTATDKLKKAVQEYDNALAVLNDNVRRRSALEKARQTIFEGIDDPTLQRPKIDSSNLKPPGLDPKGDGKGGGRGRKEKSAEELAAMRAELDLQQRINQARAAGADKLAEFLEDQATLVDLTQRLKEAGVSPEEAQARATAYIDQLKAARELGEVEAEREDMQKEAAKAREEEEERIEDLRRRNLFLQEQELQVQLEIARNAGDSPRVKELERQLELLQRIREYEDFGGLAPENAREKAEKDQEAIDQAKISGNIRDAFKDGVRAALDGDLSGFLENFWLDALSRANDRVIDNLFNALEQIDWSSIFGGSGGGGLGQAIANGLGSIFGGGRAGGGLMRRGRVYKVGENGPELVTVDAPARVTPNSQYRAMTEGSGGGSLNIQVVNNTGVPAKASVERTTSGAKISLQPMFDEGIKGSGQTGALKQALAATPRTTRRA